MLQNIKIFSNHKGLVFFFCVCVITSPFYFITKMKGGKCFSYNFIFFIRLPLVQLQQQQLVFFLKRFDIE